MMVLLLARTPRFVLKGRLHLNRFPTWLPAYTRNLNYEHVKIDASKQIRLLKLLGGSENEPIRCQFLTSYLRPVPPDYVAISYSWGDPTLKHEIDCGGRSLGITENVRVLLEHLRYPKTDRIVWIDALCIDQANLEDRSKQVQLMGKIYEMADKVMIWLGPEGEDSGLLDEFVPRLARALTEFRKLKLANEEYMFLKTGTTLESPDWAALKHLFQRPWFNRAWVVQEYVVNTRREFLCGRTIISADILSEAASSIRGLYLDGSKFLSSLGFDWGTLSKFLRMAKISRWYHSGDRLSLAYLTYGFWDSLATDPRDKIFSILALVENLSLRMKPDYRESVQNIYTRSIHITPQENNIGVLSLAGIGHQRTLPDLPSWVPDFSHPTAPTPPFGLHRYRGWNSSTKLRFRSNGVHIDGEKLTVRGVKVDTVASLGRAIEMRTCSETDLGQWFREVEDMFSTSWYAHEGSSLDELWRSLIADRIFEGEEYVTAPSIYGAYFEYFKENLKSTKRTTQEGHQDPLEPIDPLESSESDAVYARRFAQALAQSASGRRFCVTSNGDIGFVPKFTEAGDMVCILAGLYVPFVIRPIPSTQGHHQTHALVGESYIHGIMKSEELDLSNVEMITMV